MYFVVIIWSMLSIGSKMVSRTFNYLALFGEKTCLNDPVTIFLDNTNEENIRGSVEGIHLMFWGSSTFHNLHLKNENWNLERRCLECAIFLTEWNSIRLVKFGWKAWNIPKESQVMIFDLCKYSKYFKEKNIFLIHSIT